MAVQFSYDGQIRRFVIQFIRMVSGFQVEFGKNSDGNHTLQTVPVYYGDASRQAAMILRGNSENSLNSVPAMACYISGLTYDRERVQNPYHEGSIRVNERAYNEVTDSYESSSGGLYTVDRMMPAPYKLTIKLDIWTSNTEQKHQILEQIIPLFNPGLEIQSNDNFIDWTSLSVVLLTSTDYTNRSIPSGAEESIDVATLTFELPIWISLPAKVKKGGVVSQIVASVYTDQGALSEAILVNLQGLVARQQFTPMNYEVLFVGNSLTLYKHGVTESYGTVYGQTVKWNSLISLYGRLTNGISQIRLTFDSPTGLHQMVGTVAYSPTDETQLLFTPDPSTLPANTMAPVDAIIDPMTVNVAQMHLLNPTAGTRYLILNPIGEANTDPAIAWRGTPGTNLIAKANDIIEWNGNYWHVSFDSQNNPGVQYVANLKTTVQYCWNGTQWVKSYEGFYKSGMWSLVP
jgi:hypothetical protein